MIAKLLAAARRALKQIAEPDPTYTRLLAYAANRAPDAFERSHYDVIRLAKHYTRAHNAGSKTSEYDFNLAIQNIWVPSAIIAKQRVFI